MELREHRGMELAATRTIRQKAGSWIVPSQSGNGLYRVQLANKFASCTCPDFETRGQLASISSQPLLLFAANKTRMVL